MLFVARLVLLFSLILAGTLTRPVAVLAQAPQGVVARVKFSRDILPLMREECGACHSGSAAPGGYSQETAAKFLAGGRHGAAVVPGKSKESTLIKYMTGELKPQMPPGAPLPLDKIALIRRWIDEGGKIDSMTVAPPATSPSIKASVKAQTKTPATTQTNPSLLPRTIEPSAGVSKLPLPEAVRQVAPITALSYAPDGKMVAVGSYRTVWLLDPGAGSIVRTLSGPGDQVLSLAWSSDGARLAAAGGTPGVAGEICLWETGDWKSPKIIRAHTDSIFSLAWKPNSQQFATASLDKTVQLWDALAGTSILTFKDHVDPVFAVAFSPNSQWMATGSGDRSVKLYKVGEYKRPAATITHNDAVTALAFNPKSDLLITACVDKQVRVWPVKLDALANPLRGHGAGDIPNAVAFSADGNAFVWGTADHKVRFWNGDLTSQKQETREPTDWVYSVAISPDGKTVIAGMGNGSLYIWREDKGKPLGDKAASIITPATIAGETVKALTAEQKPADQKAVELKK